MDGITTTPSPVADAGYDADFHAWSMAQARLIRGLTIPGLDSENVAEEIESLGRSDRRELLTRSTVLLAHLLKWQFQPDRRSDSWVLTIDEQRRSIAVVLDESPSLRPTVSAVLDKAYRQAVKVASRETRLPIDAFPAQCSWAARDVTDEDWLPD